MNMRRAAVKQLDPTKKIIKGLESQLEKLASIHEAKKALERQEQEIQLEMFHVMQEHKILKIEADGNEAEIVRKQGRATNVINVEKFQKLVSAKDFYECVTVGVTKAKAVLPAKELAAITTCVPAEVKEPELAVSYVLDKKVK